MKNGYILLEVIVAIVMFSLILIPVFSSLSYLQIRTREGEYDSEATNLLQDGTEIARTNLLSDWSGYTDGEYHPIYNATQSTWELAAGKETNVNAKYDRIIYISSVCRNPSTGEQTGSCIEKDVNSRLITTTIEWDEHGDGRELQTSLLLFKKDNR